MPVELSTEPKDGYLRFEITGVRVPGQLAPEMLRVWGRVADECETKRIRRVLGVSHLQGPATDIDMYAIASKLPQVLHQAGCASAALVVRDPTALSANRFSEDVAVNRGLRIRVFSDETSALRWLTS